MHLGHEACEYDLKSSRGAFFSRYLLMGQLDEIGILRAKQLPI